MTSPLFWRKKLHMKTETKRKLSKRYQKWTNTLYASAASALRRVSLGYWKRYQRRFRNLKGYRLHVNSTSLQRFPVEFSSSKRCTAFETNMADELFPFRKLYRSTSPKRSQTKAFFLLDENSLLIACSIKIAFAINCGTYLKWFCINEKRLVLILLNNLKRRRGRFQCLVTFSC